MRDKVEKNLDDIFDIETEIIEPEVIEPKRIENPVNEKRDLDQDYKTVRSNLKNIITTGSEAIENILQVATETESPRAYEVAAQMIKTVADANKDLVDLHKKLKDINKETNNVKNVTNNALFVGSTKELQMMMKEQHKLLEQDDMIDAED